MLDTDQWNDHYAQGKNFRPVTEQEVELLAGHLGPGAGRRALDLGCGTGEYAAVLHGLGFTTTGADFSKVAVTTAQDRNQDRDGLDFQLLDINRGGLSLLPAAGYHLVTFRLVLPFVDLVPTIACARNLLVPGGRLLVTTPVTERQTPGYRSSGLPTADIDLLLSFGWAAVTEYPLDGLLCLLLTTHPVPEATSR
ncbi:MULTISPECIES: class I SAM-dependent methyltransferase [unclassified Kitasatospora]|uniref:class I SAM-dependent methyltransferase n=1 Tax=unclassified Kitasatospora TaxID=2633591 RepID=UPI0033C6EE9E